MVHIFEDILSKEIRNQVNLNGQIRARIMESLLTIGLKVRANLYGKTSEHTKDPGKIT
jgi:hypothetical protein